MSRAPSSCPACDSDNRNGSGYILFCGSCGHRWLRTTEEERRSVEAGTYTHDYAGYRPDPAFTKTATEVTRAELTARVPPPARILDVGCGAGDFMTVATAAGYQVEGIDISEASAEICRSRGLDARAANFLTYEFATQFDLITMWDVVEHLREPASFFRRARVLLRGGGYLFAKIPSFGDLSVRLANFWPRTAGTLLGAPSHVQYFDRDSLTALLERTGFQPEWFDAGRARSQKTGGPLKRRVARLVRSGIQPISGDANLYFIARPL